MAKKKKNRRNPAKNVPDCWGSQIPPAEYMANENRIIWRKKKNRRNPAKNVLDCVCWGSQIPLAEYMANENRIIWRKKKKSAQPSQKCAFLLGITDPTSRVYSK